MTARRAAVFSSIGLSLLAVGIALWVPTGLPVTVSLATPVSADDKTASQEQGESQPAEFPPVSDSLIKRYTAYRATTAIKVDGRLDEPDWKAVPRSPRFVDLISGRQTIHDTRAAVMWDDEFLYVGFWVEEPFTRAKFLERDKPIYRDNDVEFFLAFDDAYYEFEINAHGTIYEGLFVWQEAYERSGFSQVAEIDKSRDRVTFQPFNGVGLKTHPRGLRWAFLKWDFPQAQTAVHIDGTLNDDTDRDRGWTVELAFPWSGMRIPSLGDNRAIPPRSGDTWRMDFSRFNQYREAAPAKDSSGWAWSHHGVWDSHVPEVFPYITFSASPVTARKRQ